MWCSVQMLRPVQQHGVAVSQALVFFLTLGLRQGHQALGCRSLCVCLFAGRRGLIAMAALGVS